MAEQGVNGLGGRLQAVLLSMQGKPALTLHQGPIVRQHGGFERFSRLTETPSGSLKRVIDSLVTGRIASGQHLGREGE
jgi:hypothetical protein